MNKISDNVMKSITVGMITVKWKKTLAEVKMMNVSSRENRSNGTTQ